MRARTSESYACGSTRFIFAVYAARRTIPKGVWDDRLLGRAGSLLGDAGPRSIRHSLLVKRFQNSNHILPIEFQRFGREGSGPPA